MSEEEKELREKIADEIKSDLNFALEQCACMGRDAYGALPHGPYINRMRERLLTQIKGEL